MYNISIVLMLWRKICFLISIVLKTIRKFKINFPGIYIRYLITVCQSTTSRCYFPINNMNRLFSNNKKSVDVNNTKAPYNNQYQMYIHLMQQISIIQYFFLPDGFYILHQRFQNTLPTQLLMSFACPLATATGHRTVRLFDTSTVQLNLAQSNTKLIYYQSYTMYAFTFENNFVEKHFVSFCKSFPEMYQDNYFVG